MEEATTSMQSYLREICIPLRLACLNSSGWPLVLSLWYLLEDGKLYCATQADARVVTCLRREPRCAFEVASDLPPYCGVRGRATARIDPTRGEEILVRLLDRYLGGKDNPLAKKLLSRVESEVALELFPERWYSWNFTERMTDSIPDPPSKPCP